MLRHLTVRGRVFVFVAAAAVVLSGCASLSTGGGALTSEDSPRNVILMIGDGMGVAHVTAAKVELGELNMERFSDGGICTTFPVGELVTDSAAGGTALATGHKTVNGSVSVSPDGRPMETVLERAEQSGMATGIVTACSVTHATPAVFMAHVDDRGKDFEIAEQIASTDVDVLFGGGRSYFLPKSDPRGARRDGRNLLDGMRERMTVVLSARDFRELPGEGDAAGLFADEQPAPASWRNPPLPELAAKALEILSAEESGFFLMIEGSQIDWAGHENDQKWLMEEMRDFEETVGIVMDFAEADGRTLVVLTADHETGAYAVLDGSLEKRVVSQHVFGSEHHSASMVPVLSYGPSSGLFGGITDNTDIGRMLMELVTR
jgi:alkaline phosphatase